MKRKPVKRKQKEDTKEHTWIELVQRKHEEEEPKDEVYTREAEVEKEDHGEPEQENTRKLSVAEKVKLFEGTLNAKDPEVASRSKKAVQRTRRTSIVRDTEEQVKTPDVTKKQTANDSQKRVEDLETTTLNKNQGGDKVCTFEKGICQLHLVVGIKSVVTKECDSNQVTPYYFYTNNSYGWIYSSTRVRYVCPARKNDPVVPGVDYNLRQTRQNVRGL